MNMSQNIELKLSLSEFNYLLCVIRNFIASDHHRDTLDHYFMKSIGLKLETIEANVYGKSE